MEISQVISILVLATALTATTISSLLSLRAIKLAQNANHVGITINLLAAQRSGEFFRKEMNLWTELSKQDPILGYQKLPEPLRSDVVDISMYYHALGYLSEYGYADRDFFIVQTQYRMMRTWKVVEPFVQGERVLREGATRFLNAYENFAADADKIDIPRAMERLAKGGRRRKRGL